MTPVYRRILVWFVAVVSFGFVAWIALRDAEVLEALTSISIEGFLLLVVAQVVYLVVSSRRFEIVVESVSGRSLPWLGMLGIYAVGRFLNLIFPQLGNAYRGVRLNTSYGVDVSLFAGALGAFVWMTVTLSSATAAVVLGVSESDLDIGPLPAWIVMVIATLALIALPTGVFLAGRRALDPEHSSRLRRRLSVVVEAAASATMNPALLARFGITWAAAVAVVVPMYRLTFSLTDHPVTFGQMLALFTLVQATSFIVVTPGNIGIQDLGFVAVAVAFGIPASAAAASAGLIRASGILALTATAAATGWHDVRTTLERRTRTALNAEEPPTRAD